MNLHSAINWSVLDRIINYSITIIISAILARLIPPEDFGMLAMVTVFTGFFSIFKNFGLSSSLIHYQDTTKKEIDSIFWFIAGVSMVLALLIAAGSPAIASFYHNNKLIPLTFAVAFLFFIQSIGIIPDTLIRKKLDFKSFFFRNLTGNILSGITGITFAFLGFGVWALLIKQFVANIWTIFASFKVAGYFPSFYFNLDYIKRHLSFGLPLLGERTMNYFTRNIDTMMVGKWMGERTVGYYSRAYGLMLMPLRQITSSISRVFFPAFSQIQNDKEKIWNQYGKLIQLTSFVTFPLMTGLFILADEIILFLYGQKWLPTVPIFKGFAFIGAIQSVAAYIGTLFQSLGRTKLLFNIGLIVKPLMISGILGGLYLGGISGLIIGYTLASLISFLIETYFITKLLNKDIFSFFVFLKPQFFILIVSFSITLVSIYGWNIHNHWIKIGLVFISSIIYLYLSKKKGIWAFQYIFKRLMRYG